MDIDGKQTTIYLNIRFEEDDQHYYLLNYEVSPDSISEKDDSELTARPARLSFNAHRSLQTNDEITEAIVDYLSSLRLYLYSYSITSNRTYVSYTRKTPALSDKLTFSPTYQTLEIYADVEVQKENGVDYDKELGIKLHHPINTITPREIKNLGLEFEEIGVEIPAILREDELPSDY